MLKSRALCESRRHKFAASQQEFWGIKLPTIPRSRGYCATQRGFPWAHHAEGGVVGIRYKLSYCCFSREATVPSSALDRSDGNAEQSASDVGA